MLWVADVLAVIAAALMGPLGIALAALAMAGAGVAWMASGSRVRARGVGPEGPAGQESEE